MPEGDIWEVPSVHYDVPCDVCGRMIGVTLGLNGSNHTMAVWVRCAGCVKVPAVEEA